MEDVKGNYSVLKATMCQYIAQIQFKAMPLPSQEGAGQSKGGDT